ncbi:MAG: VOC family protein [Pseudomonadales bacterium]|nr:VOC family protein [Pseudomonadales bacterium]
MTAMAQKITHDPNFKVKTQGLHHAAYLTKDMDATVQFYNKVLDMPLVVTLALPSPDPFAGQIKVRGDVAGTRHYFFDCGQGACLAFFSWNETFGDTSAELGVMHHVSLNIGSEEELYAMKAKLEANDIEVSNVIDHFFCKSIYFRDPNGLYLEYSVTTLEYTENTPFLEDPNPVREAVKVLGDKMEKYKTKFREGHDFVDAGNKKQ